MLLWTMDQMRELQLQWARELYWQEGQARGAIRTCKAMGLDFADAYSICRPCSRNFRR